MIEIKIYDTNHHFEQYVETFNIPKERLGYITNYHMTKLGFTVHTWGNFYDEILKQLPKDENEKELWICYSSYLKNVCSIIKITKEMDLNGMYSLYSFNEIIKKIVNRDEVDFELSYYSNKNIQGGAGISGNYFHIKYKNVDIKDTWAWIGVYYEREEPLICIGFENKDGWGKPIFDLIDSNLNKLNEGELTTLPYLISGSIWFELTKEKHKEFQTCDLEAQIQMLKDFLDEVIKFPLNILKKNI
ncbi:hypothetical protein SAMN06265371_104144 [Lutibacter agarilyticus]|uniref:Uncharacterized protein n=1 Tax=Lutibacter agarilyticus TaxID=1109740 RepID=A0A238WWJ4_9FLAO|nr:hypothetical protein [Lutibacter agarilyticus]SNR51005.1 hypothetical protein SAMN06265371_104144 [Lutibacter agarilyticus]